MDTGLAYTATVAGDHTSRRHRVTKLRLKVRPSAGRRLRSAGSGRGAPVSGFGARRSRCPGTGGGLAPGRSRTWCRCCRPAHRRTRCRFACPQASCPRRNAGSPRLTCRLADGQVVLIGRGLEWARFEGDLHCLTRSDSPPTVRLTTGWSKMNLSTLSTTHDDTGPWVAHAEETSSSEENEYDIDDTPVTTRDGPRLPVERGTRRPRHRLCR
jgi:hypothetical protein